EVFEEVEVPKGAAELAVRDLLEPDLLLLPDERADFAVLDRLKVRRGDLALRELFASILESSSAEKAADHVGPERGLAALHGSAILSMRFNAEAGGRSSSGR